MDIRELVRKEVIEGNGYQQELSPVKIKLDANEFPYSLTRDMEKELADLLEKMAFNRYPDPQAAKIREIAARSLGVEPEMVMFGNGSDELIQILLIALAGGKPKAVVPVPTFTMYEISASFLGYQVSRVPLDADFDLDVPAILHAAKRGQPKVLFLSYPNNPTGNCFSADRIKTLLEEFPGLVVIDEAYYHFSRRSFLPYLADYANLVVSRSMSKIGLAGLRVGFLIGHKDLVAQLMKVKLPYNLGLLSQRAAFMAISNMGPIEVKVQEVIEERENLLPELNALPGLRPYPSQANFILFKVDGDADLVHSFLLDKGISIRNLGSVPGLRGCLRVTLGKPGENRAFLEALKESLNRARGQGA